MLFPCLILNGPTSLPAVIALPPSTIPRAVKAGKGQMVSKRPQLATDRSSRVRPHDVHSGPGGGRCIAETPTNSRPNSKVPNRISRAQLCGPNETICRLHRMHKRERVA